jgi:hypothetical protein
LFFTDFCSLKVFLLDGFLETLFRTLVHSKDYTVEKNRLKRSFGLECVWDCVGELTLRRYRNGLKEVGENVLFILRCGCDGGLELL